MKEIQLRTILNSRTGMKYYAGPDLISYLAGMKEDRPEKVQEFIFVGAENPSALADGMNATH